MEFEKILNQRNLSNPFARYLGIRVVELSAGHSRVEMKTDYNSLNPFGSVHGGLMFTCADIAAGSAVASTGRIGCTVSSSINYLKPGVDTSMIIAEGNIIKYGKTLQVCRVEVRDQDGTLLCEATFTYMTLSEAALNHAAAVAKAHEELEKVVS